MDTLVVIICATLVLIGFLGFVEFRNQWVYNQRVKLRQENFEEYYKLESYNAMVLKFWIWDIKKFIKEKK